MTILVTIDAGGQGRATAFAGEVLTVRIDRPYAVGTPLVIAVNGSGIEATIETKVVAARRIDDLFELRLRGIHARKDLRERLTEALK